MPKINTTLQNKELITHFFNALNQKDFVLIESLLSDDLHWWIIGNIKTSGNRDKRVVIFGLKYIYRILSDFKFTIHDITAEEDRVAITAESKGNHRNGKFYNNHYHFLFFINEQKICRVKEYFDTHLAAWIEE